MLKYAARKATLKIMNSYSINYTKKTSSILLLTLLLLSPLVAIVAISPSLPAAHAATAGSISLNSSSGVPYWVPQNSNDYLAYGNAGSFGTFVTATGTGFPSGQTNIDICYLSTTQTVAPSCLNGVLLSANGNMGAHALVDPTIAGAGHTVTADANGYFQVQYYVPDVAGGTYNVYAVYTPTGGSPVMTTPVVYTVTTSFIVLRDVVGSTTARFSKSLDMIALGFGSGELLQLIPSTWFGATAVGATGKAIGVDQGAVEFDAGAIYNAYAGASVGTGVGCPCLPAASTVPSAIGGAATLTALGLTTGDSAKATFNVASSISTYGYAAGACTAVETISIPATATGVVCLAGYGFAASTTIATASSITIGGVATHHSSITTAADGSFGTGGAANEIPVQLTAAPGTGLVSVVFGGTTFSFQNANIQPGSHALVASTAAAGGSVQTWDASSGTASSGYVGDMLYLIGSGFAKSSAAASGPFTFGFGSAIPYAGWITAAQATTDANGAFVFGAAVPSEPHSLSGYIIKDTSGNSFSNTYSVMPSVGFDGTGVGTDCFAYVPDTTTAFCAFGYTPEISGSGFTAGETLTVSIMQSDATWQTIGAAVVHADGTLPAMELATIGVSPTPDLPTGTYSVNVTGSTGGNWAVSSNDILVLPEQTFSAFGCAAVAAGVCSISSLSINSGNGGQSVALITSLTSGLHGLAANTQYSIMWDTTTQVGTFTSTANGQVPIGTQFVVPAGTSGLHIVDIQSGGVSAIYASSLTGVSQFGSAIVGPVAGCPGVGQVCQFDLIFNLLTSLTVSPSLVGALSTATLTGSGLPASTQLYVVDPATSIGYASFMSTAGGSVPSGISFTVPQLPSPDIAGGELGTPVTWNILNALGNPVGTLVFIYHTTLTLSSTAGPAGSTITVTANGLKAIAGNVYNVIFNCIPGIFATSTCSGTGSGSAPANLVVGALVANGLGYASGIITIPAGAAQGSYVIGVTVSAAAGAHTTPIGTQVLAVPPTFTVGGQVSPGNSFTIMGTPTTTSVGGTPFESVTYTNGGTAQVTGIVIISVQNALGQTVYIATSIITPAAGQSQTALLDLGLLASGTYTANIFVLSTSGGSVSAPTSVTSITV